MLDFYNLINKKWLDNITIPDDSSSINNFVILEKKILKKLKKIIENVNDNNILKILYIQGQQYKINNIDIKILKKFICNILQINNISDLFTLMFNYNINYGINFPLEFNIYPNLINSKLNILHINSGGINLPDKDYYLLDKHTEIVNNYKDFIKNYLNIFNIKLDIDIIYDIEKKLAYKIWNKTEQRLNENKSNNILYEELIKKFPKFKFIDNIFKFTDSKNRIINLVNIEYIEYFNSLNINLYNWKQYFIYQILLHFNSYFTYSIKICYWNFFSKFLLGNKNINSKWEISLNITSTVLGELLGELYIKYYYNKKNNIIINNIINYIKKELKLSINNNKWMSEYTKNNALYKLKNMNTKIGYNNCLEKKYSKLIINNNNTYFQNMLNVLEFNNNFLLNNLYKPVNKSKWSMYSFTVNAYNDPNFNEIVIPAGILQKPFYYKSNIIKTFGAIGTIIGHEIIHGFDDQGCKYDGNGNLNQWWTDEDLINYNKTTEIVVKQYNNFIIDNIHVNGLLTLGENIADIGGIKLSFNALIKYLYDHNIKYDNKMLKQFFISYAIMWRCKIRQEKIKYNLINDPHSPPIFRVNGVINNMKEFYDIYDIKNYNNNIKFNIW
jgi:putative endopeptidase